LEKTISHFWTTAQQSHEAKLIPLSSFPDFQSFLYRAFHGFGQAKFPNGGSVLGSSQFSIPPQLPQKTMLGLKQVKIDSKTSNLSG